MSTPRLTLLTAPGCCLCDTLKATLVAAGLLFEEQDIHQLAGGKQWRPHLPVLLVDGEPVFRYKATATQVRRALSSPLYRGFRLARLRREMGTGLD